MAVKENDGSKLWYKNPPVARRLVRASPTKPVFQHTQSSSYVLGIDVGSKHGKIRAATKADLPILYFTGLPSRRSDPL